MDFIGGLPRTSDGMDSIWVIMDRLTKVAHFIPVATGYTVDKYVQIFLEKIVLVHSMPKSIT